MAWDELDDQPSVNPLVCEPCLRTCEVELPKCPGCGKRFCDFCVFRIGGKEYCGRSCGVRTFFGGGEDDDEADE